MTLVPKKLDELSKEALEIYYFLGFFKKMTGEFPTQTEISEKLKKSRQHVHLMVNKQLISRNLVEFGEKKEMKTSEYIVKRKYETNKKVLTYKK